MSYPFQRATYRIYYPQAERPRFLWEGVSLEVIDCSEHGIRFRMTPDAMFERDQVVAGVLRFRGGLELELEGTVIRLQDGCAAIHLDTPIPFAVILNEQRELRRRYLDP